MMKGIIKQRIFNEQKFKKLNRTLLYLVDFVTIIFKMDKCNYNKIEILNLYEKSI